MRAMEPDLGQLALDGTSDEVMVERIMESRNLTREQAQQWLADFRAGKRPYVDLQTASGADNSGQ